MQGSQAYDIFVVVCLPAFVVLLLLVCYCRERYAQRQYVRKLDSLSQDRELMEDAYSRQTEAQEAFSREFDRVETKVPPKYLDGEQAEAFMEGSRAGKRDMQRLYEQKMCESLQMPAAAIEKCLEYKRLLEIKITDSSLSTSQDVSKLLVFLEDSLSDTKSKLESLKKSLSTSDKQK